MAKILIVEDDVNIAKMLEVIIHPMEQDIAPGSTYSSGVFLFGSTL